MSSTQEPNDVDLEQGGPNTSMSSPKPLPIRSDKSLKDIWEVCLFGIALFLFSLFMLLMFLVLLVLPIVFISPLIVALLAARFLRLISGNAIINANSKIQIIKGLLFLCVVFFLFEMPIYLPIAKFTPSLKHAMILDLSLPKWVTLASMIFGFYVLGFLLSGEVHVMLLFQLKIYNNYRISVGESISQIIDCLISLWAECEILKLAPIFREYKTLSLPTYKWINAAIFALIGCNCITLFTNLVVWLSELYALKLSPKLKNVSYYTNGISRSINFLLFSLMFLLIWVSYFGSHLNLEDDKAAKRVLHIGTMTLVSLVICSLLWLIKTCTVLAWEAQAIYSRILFSRSMLEQLHLLPLIVVDYLPTIAFWSKISTPWWELALLPLVFVIADYVFPSQMYYAVFDSPKEDTTYARKQISLALLDAKDNLKTPSEKGLPDSTTTATNILQKLSTYTADDADDNKIVKTQDLLEDILKKHKTNIRDAFELVLSIYGGPLNNFPEEMSLGEMKKCLNKAVNNWLMLANIISSSLEMVDCLDRIMSWAIFGATFVIWLLLTRVATTKILVLFASPLLAASFIFGDTCKSLFQGIMFVYAVRPFSVGDECQVGEDSQLRVVSIGVWKTTFSKTQNEGKVVEVIYPNSELANKRVLINRKFNLEELRKQELESEKDEIKRDDQSDLQGSNQPAATIENVINRSVVIARESFLRGIRGVSSSLHLQHITMSSNLRT